jgi:hypothetical protein
VRAPRPAFVIVALFALTLIVMPKGDLPGGPFGLGYLVGILMPAALLSALYVWWYRRHTS